jgi:maleylacetoacetate isomerase
MIPSNRFTLYSYWRTSATYRVRVALNLKGVAATEVNINLDAGEQRSEAFLKINPLGAIPALIDHDSGHASQPNQPLTQSLAILEFLDEAYPTPALLPVDLHARARVRSIASMLAADTHPMVTPRVKKYLMSTAKFDDVSWKAWQTQWFTTGLQALEARLVSDQLSDQLSDQPSDQLSSKPTPKFCHGDTPTIADICLASIIVVMRVFKVEVADIPNVMRIMGECEKIEAFAKADPSKQVGAPKLA